MFIQHFCLHFRNRSRFSFGLLHRCWLLLLFVCRAIEDVFCSLQFINSKEKNCFRNRFHDPIFVSFFIENRKTFSYDQQFSYSNLFLITKSKESSHVWWRRRLAGCLTRTWHSLNYLVRIVSSFSLWQKVCEFELCGNSFLLERFAGNALGLQRLKLL